MDKYIIQNLFGVEGWNIAWYGMIIAGGMLLGLALAVYRGKQEGIHSDVFYDFLLITAPVAIVCARAYYVALKAASSGTRQPFSTNPYLMWFCWLSC